MDIMPKYLLPVLAALFISMLGMEEGVAEFALNFQPSTTLSSTPGIINLSCNRGADAGCVHGTAPDPQKTAFLSELVTDGKSDYWHQIIGTPSQGFAQETFIKVGVCCWPNGQPGSSSVGLIGNGGFSGPALGPLDSTAAGSGTGTGNPLTVQLRMVLNDGGMTQEFLKGTFATKPKITQDIATPDISAHFVADMSAIPYTGATATSTPAKITNTLTLAPSSGGSFDVVTGGQQTNVTAGSFIWTPGTGTAQSNGTYSYTNGDFNLNGIDWKAAYNPAQNTCWSYKQNPGPVPCTP